MSDIISIKNSRFPGDLLETKNADWIILLNKLNIDDSFSHFISRFINYAQTQLHTITTYQKFSHSARQDLLSYLTQRLEKLCQQVITLKTALQSRSLFNLPSNKITNIHLDFSEILTQYPVLARLAAQLTLDFISFSKDFLNHLSRDWRLIEQQFQQKLTQVTQLKTGLSDPHHHGRSVIILKFNSGFKIVYKPRDLTMEAFYFQFITTLNPHLNAPLRMVKVVNRIDYGWMEHIETKLCQTKKQQHKYIRRCGYLLAIARILRGSDFHIENLIQHDEQPVLIDLETLLQPEQPYAFNLLSKTRRLLDGVLATHLCDFVMKNETVDKRIMLVRLTEGFSEAYQVIIKNDLLKQCVLPKNTRSIYQDTALYELLLEHALQLQYLKNGREFARQFDFLERSVDLFADQITTQRFQTERHELMRLDIPYFTSHIDITNDNLRRGLNSADLERQLHYLHSEFYLQNPTLRQSDSDSSAQYKSCSLSQLKRTTQAKIQTLCQQQVKTILERVECNQQQDYYWLIIKRLQKKGYGFFVSDYGLYEGNSGLLIFLAAWYHIKPQNKLKNFILNVMVPMQQLWLQPQFSQALTKSLDLGMAEGLGGLIYSLCKISLLLQQPELLQTAVQIAKHIDLKKIQQDSALDIFAGTAGMLIALTVLYDLTKNPSIFKTAQICAAQLLSKQANNGSWNSLNNQAIAGFAHGVSGIAYSLLRFYQFHANKQYLNAIEKALVFENQFFDANANNWRAMASTTESPQFWDGYCHGAAGIGLGRLALIDNNIQSKIARQDLEKALLTVIQHENEAFDFPCCGETGKLALLAQAGQQLDRNDLLMQAWQKAGWILQRKQTNNGFYLFDEFPTEVDNLSFFKGSTGCAYQLLHLCYPGQLPSILMFE